MARRRRGMELAVTFFSFQDIMMCALGVMVFLCAVVVLLRVNNLVAAVGSSESAPHVDAVEREQRDLVKKVHELEAMVRRAQEALGRDVDRDLASVHTKLAVLKEAQVIGDAMLRRLLEQHGLKQVGAKIDPLSKLALELIEQRDSLIQELDGLSQRRKLVFQQRRSDGLRTRVFEVAGHRIVEAFEDSTSNAIMHTFSTPQEGANIFQDRMNDAQKKGHAVLVVLKPSGVPVYQRLWPNEGEVESSPLRPTHFGIDLISEDGWISDEHPAAKGGGD